MIKKIDDYTAEVTKELPTPKPVVTKYERSFIENQIVAITEQRDEMIALKEAELKECEDILAVMEKEGIIAKPVPSEILNDKIME
jgi:hypothetical protein